MSRAGDGGPAFPRPHSWDESPMKGIHEGDRPAAHREQDGMSLRDYFAAAALQGMAAHYGTRSAPTLTGAIAYELADAMLAARSKK